VPETQDVSPVLSALQVNGPSGGLADNPKTPNPKTAMNKEAYVAKLKTQLDEWNAELDQLEARVRGAAADVRLKYEEQLRSLRQQRDEARRKLEQIQSAAADAWEQLTQGVEDAWNALKEAVTKAKAQFD
jgi:chromosome segregation ATPase